MTPGVEVLQQLLASWQSTCSCLGTNIWFLIRWLPQLPLILRPPWLCCNNPNVDWPKGAILGWSSSYHNICLKQATEPDALPDGTLLQMSQGCLLNTMTTRWYSVRPRPYLCLHIAPTTVTRYHSIQRSPLFPVCTRERLWRYTVY